jgi:hypothetical protein
MSNLIHKPLAPRQSCPLVHLVFYPHIIELVGAEPEGH